MTPRPFGGTGGTAPTLLPYPSMNTIAPSALALFAGISIAFCPACKRAPNSSSPDTNSGGGGGELAPGAKNEGPVVETYDYSSDEFNYERDGTITRNGKAFTGRATLKHSDGETLKSALSFKDGLYDGDIIEYYENGQRSSFKQYKAGKRHGITTYWDESGTPTRQVLYEDDIEKQEITDPEQLKKIAE